MYGCAFLPTIGPPILLIILVLKRSCQYDRPTGKRGPKRESKCDDDTIQEREQVNSPHQNAVAHVSCHRDPPTPTSVDTLKDRPKSPLPDDKNEQALAENPTDLIEEMYTGCLGLSAVPGLPDISPLLDTSNAILGLDIPSEGTGLITDTTYQCVSPVRTIPLSIDREYPMCRYPCLLSVFPLLETADLSLEEACDVLDTYFAKAETSAIETRCPYILSPIIRRESLQKQDSYRPTSTLLLLVILWTVSQTANLKMNTTQRLFSSVVALIGQSIGRICVLYCIC